MATQMISLQTSILAGGCEASLPRSLPWSSPRQVRTKRSRSNQAGQDAEGKKGDLEKQERKRKVAQGGDEAVVGKKAGQDKVSKRARVAKCITEENVTGASLDAKPKEVRKGGRVSDSSSKAESPSPSSCTRSVTSDAVAGGVNSGAYGCSKCRHAASGCLKCNPKKMKMDK